MSELRDIYQKMQAQQRQAAAGTAVISLPDYQPTDRGSKELQDIYGRLYNAKKADFEQNYSAIQEKIIGAVQGAGNLYEDDVKAYNGRRAATDKTYVTDAQQWYNSSVQKKAAYDTKAKEALQLIEEYEPFLSAEWVRQAREGLSAMGRGYTAMSDNADMERQYWAQFPTQEEWLRYTDPERAQMLADAKSKWYENWFQKGAMEDGFSWSGLGKTIAGTWGDAAEDVWTGLVGMGEKALDAIMTVLPYMAEGYYYANGGGYNLQNDAAFRQMNDSAKQLAEDFVKQDLYDERAVVKTFTSKPIEAIAGIDTEQASILGDKTDALAQSYGQLMGQLALTYAGVPWWVTSGATSLGAETENALHQGATMEQAAASGLVNAGAEILTEKLFGGSGLGEKGLINLDKLTQGISNKVVKTLLDYGVDMAAEGGEEFLSQVMSNLASKLYKEENLGQLLASEEAIQGYIESFIGGMALSGGMNVGKVTDSVVTQTDYRTGLTAEQQKVFDKAYSEAIADAQASGIEMTDHYKRQVHDNLIELVKNGSLAGAGQVTAGQTQAQDLDSGVQSQAAANAAIPGATPTLQEQIERNWGIDTQTKNAAQRQTQAAVEQQDAVEVQDINEVYLAARAAMESGAMPEARFNEINEALAYAFSDHAEGNISDETYNDLLSAAMQQVKQASGPVSRNASRATSAGLQVDVDPQIWQQAQRLATALRRDIMFYNGNPSENGFFKDGTIWVNTQAADPFAQVISHELTHSLEGTKQYEKLRRFVFDKLAQSNVDVAQVREQKYRQYEAHSVELQNQRQIDSEIVAEYVQKHLLTDEQSILALAKEEPSVARRLWDKIRNMIQRFVGSKSSRGRAQLEQAERIYANALRESMDGRVKPGTVSVGQRSADGAARTDSLRQQREQTAADYRAGRITDEEYDTAMEEYDRAEAERLADSVEQYSINDKFYTQLENWDKKTTGFSFVLGETSNALQKAGIPKKQIRWDATKIVKLLEKHNGMTIDTISRIPELLENPVVVIDSKSNPNSRIVMGDVYDDHGNVVTAVLLLTPTSKKGNVLDIVKISSAEGRGHIKSLFTKEDGTPVAVRYVDKKRIQSWLNVNRLQLPLHNLDLDSINSIDDPSKNVNGQFSLSDTAQEQRLNDGTYTTDEKHLQAKKKGYPVLHGEQVVPFNTWVEVLDRGNYGLVTGLAPDNRLLVSFHNKHDGGSADNVAIPYENLKPVPGTYQMTKEEFESLMASEPLDPAGQEMTEEEMRQIEELYQQAGGEETDKPATIELDKLPKKAQRFVGTAQRRFVGKLRDLLGVPQMAAKEYLQGIVDDITAEYLSNGTVSDEKIGLLFDKAYAQGIVTDREFYDQYKHIKDHLRTNPITISQQDSSNIADYNDFVRRQFGRLRIVKQGGLPVDTAYDELRGMAPALFPESITHPADQLVHMAEVAKSIAISEKSLQEFFGTEAETFRSFAKHDFEVAVADMMGDLYSVRRYAEDRAVRLNAETPTTTEEAMEAFQKLKKARRTYEKVAAKNLLTQHDETQVGRLLRHEIELDQLDPVKDNVKGITAVYEAKREYEVLCSTIAKYKRYLKGKLRQQADGYLQTANNWKDKSLGIAYARETMRRNIYDIVPDRALAREINEVYFEPVHTSEAAATRMKDDYRNRVKKLNLSRKVQNGNLVSEAHAVQLLGEAEDNIRILENTRGRMTQRDGKTLAEWRAVVSKLWAENPGLDQTKIRNAVQEFHNIYDELFVQMNRVRVENGYEPINYRSGYFPHFQPGVADGILSQFGQALGIDTQVVALPTTISGLTHTFRPGIQWFGNAQERLGFNTAYDAIEGFDKYIEGAAGVIHHTANIQRLRALASQIRYRTSDDGIREQVDAVIERTDLTDTEKQVQIASIYENGKFTLNNFINELDEYTNLLANKKSKYDRMTEAMLGRKIYTFMKWFESRVGANMIAGNISSAVTNFIPLTQAGAQMDKRAFLHGMWQTLRAAKSDDALFDRSSFLVNRRGSDPMVKNWSQKASGVLSIPFEAIDKFASGSIVRGAYYHNLQRGMSESEAMHQADIFAAGVMADRSKGSMPTLFQASNPVFKLFTQFQLEVNNQFSEVFKDLPRNYREKGMLQFASVLFQYFLGAWLYDELFEKLLGRRPALDPIGILIDAAEDFADPEVGFGQGLKNLGGNIIEELPFTSALTMIGIETDGGRIPVSSAIPDINAIVDAATEEGWSAEKRWKELQNELNKLAYVLPPFGGNQIGKTYKGLKAYFEGGSYNVNSEGEKILQYPIYKDDPWDAVSRALQTVVFGKSSTEEAQEWVENGFDSLGSKQTILYQDLLEAGVRDRDAFQAVKDLEKAKSADGRNTDAAKFDAISRMALTDEEKKILVGYVTGTEMLNESGNPTPWAKFCIAVDEGMSVDAYCEFRTAGGDIDDYLDLTATGMKPADAAALALQLDELEPEDGAQQVKDIQKWRAAVSFSNNPSVQLAALAGVMDDSQFRKVDIAYSFDVAPETYVELREILPKFNEDGKGSLKNSEVQSAIDTMNLTSRQKAALWQIVTGNKSAKNNPYSVQVGELVVNWQ